MSAQTGSSGDDGEVKTIDLSREVVVARGAIAPPFFAWLAMAVSAIVVYTLTASAPPLGATTWQDAARLGTGWWMTTLGGATSIGGVSVSLAPSLILLVMVYSTHAVLRRRQVATWNEVGGVAVAQGCVVALIGVLLQPGGAWWPAIFGGAAAGALTAMWAGRETLLAWPWLGRAFPRTRLLLSALGVMTTAAVLVACVTGWSRITQIHGYYLAGAAGSIGLILLQLVYLPTVFIWAMAWLLGPGFAVGQGTNFSVLGVESAPLPAIPLLGALPAVGNGYPWLLAVIVVVFLTLGAVTTRRAVTALRDALVDAALAALFTAVILAVLAAVGTGAIGPERLALTGPVPAYVFGCALLIVGLPFLIGTLLIHPETWQFLQGKRSELFRRREQAAQEAEEAAAAGDAVVLGDAATNDLAGGGVLKSETASVLKVDGADRV
ncbi:MAG: DUF6350 family protein [Trueperella pyogenes]|nr:DUF6350 family protein [Trueperella pyogenes]MCI7688847.1 DUF6350 family protein [Trueperella pyogenes]